MLLIPMYAQMLRDLDFAIINCSPLYEMKALKKLMLQIRTSPQQNYSILEVKKIEIQTILTDTKKALDDYELDLLLDAFNVLSIIIDSLQRTFIVSFYQNSFNGSSSISHAVYSADNYDEVFTLIGDRQKEKYIRKIIVQRASQKDGYLWLPTYGKFIKESEAYFKRSN